MTRLEQAVRWWRGADGAPTPTRHYKVLLAHGLIEPEPDDDGDAILTAKGKRPPGEEN